MKLLYYDKYFEQLIEMPKYVQKKSIDFAKKFKANSKSPSIHLEPISNFKDQRLRSARIDQSYRAIVRVPESGDVYYMLWIDHHDKAYAWAQNKQADWNNETQSIQIFSTENILNKPVKDDEETPITGIINKLKDKELLKIGVPKILFPSIKTIRDINDLEALEEYIPDALFENLFFLLEGTDINTLMNEIKEGKAENTDLNDQASSLNNQRSFIEFSDDDDIFESIINGDFTKWKFYLHPSQRKIVEYESKGPIKVSGGAGTGKTVAALHRLKMLSEKEGSQKTIFLTYTNALTHNLEQQIKDFGIDSRKYVLSTIDSFILKLAQKYKLISNTTKILNRPGFKGERELWDELFENNVYSVDLELVIKEYTHVLLYNDIQDLKSYYRVSRIGMGKALSRRQRSEVWKIVESFEKLLSSSNYIHSYAIYNLLTNYLKQHPSEEFSNCIVDELQDLNNVHLRFIRSLIKESPNDLFLVGDPLQNIYNRKLNFTRAGIHIRGKRSRRLKINYRTSEEIRQAAISILNGVDFESFDGEIEPKSEYLSLFHGKVPNVKLYSSSDDEYAAILALIKEYCGNSLELEDVSTKQELLSNICIATRVKENLKGIKKYLHKAGVAYYDIKDRSGDKSGIRLCTFHSLKGLEFRHIILSSVNKRTCPLVPFGFDEWEISTQQSHIRKEKSLIYVAMTRAVQSVNIFGVGEKSELF